MRTLPTDAGAGAGTGTGGGPTPPEGGARPESVPLPGNVSRLETGAWPLPGRPCSVAAALNVVGDRWSLLVVRELIFGNHRFDRLARTTGAPRDRLAARLASLVDAGVVEKRQYSERPPRFEYHLTEAGWDLVPVMRALRAWGDRWAVDEPPVAFYNACGHALGESGAVCPECGAPVEARKVRAEMLVPGWDAQGPIDPE